MKSADELAGSTTFDTRSRWWDDLAADSLDLVEIALAIETNLGVVLPRNFLDEVRTCGELIAATLTLARRRHRIGRFDAEPVALRARLTPGGAASAWTIERVLLLTPVCRPVVERGRAAGRVGRTTRDPPRQSSGGRCRRARAGPFLAARRARHHRGDPSRHQSRTATRGRGLKPERRHR
jgi:acyl carrier protein